MGWSGGNKLSLLTSPSGTIFNIFFTIGAKSSNVCSISGLLPLVVYVSFVADAKCVSG